LLFDNHEEVDCYPVYRDPVHDFGILRYDPKAIKYMQVDGLDLTPEQAKGEFGAPSKRVSSKAYKLQQSVWRSAW
jgi:hypothetical protein